MFNLSHMVRDGAESAPVQQDWKFEPLPAQAGKISRKYGWLDIKIASRSFVQYTMPIVASTRGYNTTLKLGLNGLEVWSHVNYEKFVIADTCVVSAFAFMV
jgi:hypothetical protein